MVHHFIDKGMVRETISEMKNRKMAGPSACVKMVKSAGETGNWHDSRPAKQDHSRSFSYRVYS